MTLGQQFNELPGWAKGVIAVAGTAAVIGIGYAVYNKIQKAAERSQDVGKAEDDIKTLNKNGLPPSYAKSYYEDMANQIEQKFRPYIFITKAKKDDLTPFLNRLKSYRDFLELKKAFGVRNIYMGDYSLSEFIVDRTDELAQAAYNGYIRGLYDVAKQNNRI